MRRGLFDQLRGSLPGGLQTEQRRIGRLARPGIFARSLAELIGCGSAVENIVGYLKGEAERLSES